MKAEVAVMIRDGHLLQNTTVGVCFHERICPTPEDGVFAIGADALHMARIRSFASSGMEQSIR
jgi:hypothetical protein